MQFNFEFRYSDQTSANDCKTDLDAAFLAESTKLDENVSGNGTASVSQENDKWLVAISVTYLSNTDKFYLMKMALDCATSKNNLLSTNGYGC